MNNNLINIRLAMKKDFAISVKCINQLEASIVLFVIDAFLDMIIIVSLLVNLKGSCVGQ